MNKKYIIGGGIIVVFLGIMIYLFSQSNIGYENDFTKVINSQKMVRATGAWVKDKDWQYKNSRFMFYMKDEKGTEMKVVYEGAMPNNFEHATSVVVTGKYHQGVFRAKDILTKCPSKYQDAEAAKKS